mmetsp:Transcript_26643/g.80300  ORF Transcript_26643/g.80300 Transcript_26643/m.80300 type:complete len:254 (-) Transcript_26643:6-767(-)
MDGLLPVPAAVGDRVRPRVSAASDWAALGVIFCHEHIQICGLRIGGGAFFRRRGLGEIVGDAFHGVARRPIREAIAPLRRDLDDGLRLGPHRHSLRLPGMPGARRQPSRLQRSRRHLAPGVGSGDSRGAHGVRQRLPGWIRAYRLVDDLGGVPAPSPRVGAVHRRRCQFRLEHLDDAHTGGLAEGAHSRGRVFRLLGAVHSEPPLCQVSGSGDEGQDARRDRADAGAQAGARRSSALGGAGNCLTERRLSGGR